MRAKEATAISSVFKVTVKLKNGKNFSAKCCSECMNTDVANTIISMEGPISGKCQLCPPTIPKSVYETVFDRLDRLTGGIIEFIRTEQSRKMHSSGFMDLTIESFGNSRISLTHYYKQNGDLVPDPDMEILIHSDIRMAEALSYQDSFGYQTVYLDSTRQQFYPKRKNELNRFLNTWLITLKKNGFYS